MIKIQIDDEVRNATANEIAEIELRTKKMADDLATEQAEAQAKAQAKAVLLERLGLTQEEFNILTAQS
jgi:hypothetical protein